MEGDYLMRHPDRPTLVLPLRNGGIFLSEVGPASHGSRT
jgi:hypothetical protein